MAWIDEIAKTMLVAIYDHQVDDEGMSKATPLLALIDQPSKHEPRHDGHLVMYPLRLRDAETQCEDTYRLVVDLFAGRVWVSACGNRISKILKLAITN